MAKFDPKAIGLHAAAIAAPRKSKDSRRAIRETTQAILRRDPDAAAAFEAIRGNGTVHGNKVLDANASLDVLIAAATESERDALTDGSLLTMDRIRAMNGGLRNIVTVGKDWRIARDANGNIVPAGGRASTEQAEV